MGIKLVSQPLIEKAVKTCGLEDFGGDTFKLGSGGADSFPE